MLPLSVTHYLQRDRATGIIHAPKSPERVPIAWEQQVESCCESTGCLGSSFHLMGMIRIFQIGLWIIGQMGAFGPELLSMLSMH